MLMALPTAVAIGIGLVVVGLIRGRFGVVFGAVAIPLAIGVIGGSFTTAALAKSGNSAGVVSEVSTISAGMPLAVIFAIFVFLLFVLPGVVRAIKGPSGRKQTRPAHWS